MNRSLTLIGLLLLFVLPSVFAGSATITPSNPVDSDQLSCDVTGSSAVYEYYWYESNVMRKHQRAASSTISASTTVPGETWNCKAYVPSSQFVPETYHSQDSVTIAQNPNSCPEFNNPTTSFTVTENQQLQFVHVLATDADGDALSYAASSLPAGATYNPLQRRFIWTPSFNQAGTYTVTFTTTDGDCSDSFAATITVNNLNRAPVLQDITDQTVQEGSSLVFTIVASDPDGDSLTYSTPLGIPPGANFNPNTHVFSWTPDFTQAGDYQVMFRVMDPSTTAASRTITIHVLNTNRAPVLTPIGDKTTQEGEPLSFTVSATDPDGDALIFSASNLLFGAQFNAATRTFSWTLPTQGIFHPIFTVSDGSLTDTEQIDINVLNTPACQDGLDNDGDGLIDLSDIGCSSSNDDDESDTPVTACADGRDNDGDSLVDLNDPGCIDSNDNNEFNPPMTQCADGLDNDGDGLIDFFDDPGCLDASDNDEGNAPGNNAPIVVINTPISNIVINAGDPVLFTGTATDSDGIIVAFLWDFDNGASNAFVEDPGGIVFNTPGIYNVIFTAIDNLGAQGSDSVQVVVQNVAACADNVDNDGDGFTDLNDPGCVNSNDNDETNPGVLPECSDGADNDGDGFVDFPADAGCSSSGDNDETNPAGNNAPVVIINTPVSALTVNSGTSVLFTGTATDSDGIIVSRFWDFDGAAANSNQEDPGNVLLSFPGTYTISFTAVDDDGASGTDAITLTVLSAPATACSDGLDNDGDGFTDLSDPGCANGNDNDEFHVLTACSDRLDNDNDGKVDLQDPGCSSASDNSELNSNSGGNGNGGGSNNNNGADTLKELVVTEIGFINGEEYFSTNCDARNAGADLVQDVGLDKYGCVIRLDLEKQVRLVVTAFNPNRVDLKEITLTVDLLDGLVRRSDGPLTFEDRKYETSEMVLDIPRDLESGMYDVRISLHNEKTSRTIFRTIEIVRPMQTLPPVAHEVQTVAAQNTIVVQPVATKAKNDLMCPPIGAKDSLLDMIAKLLTCWINTWFS